MSCKKADCNGKPIPRGKYCEIHRTKQRGKKDTVPKAKIELKNDTKIELKNDTKIYTFKDLYEFLQHNELLEWIKTPWQGKDKQESVLRLFAGLNLIRKLDNYKVCSGNFNTMTISMITETRSVFYNDEDLIMLKDTGNSSDLTCMHKDDEKHLLVTTSKNLNRTNINNLDIADIILNFQQYGNIGYTMTLCVCIREEKEFKLMLTRVRDTNANLLAYAENAIVIDWNDLQQAHIEFKNIYHSISVADIKESKQPLLLKMHQKLGVKKTLALKNSRKKRILWGHIQRSGKSYIIGGCIIEDSKNKASCNYLIITTAPNETITQQMAVFDCLQLSSFNVARIEGDTKRSIRYTKRSIRDKNIYICSKQFLQNKTDNKRTIKWLKNINFDMRFVDESHNGGTTGLAQKTLALYGGNSFTVQITATYAKPVSEYDIPLENMILWDLDDIKLCKNINGENIALLVQKHGNVIGDIISNYTHEEIKEEYSKYPDLILLTDRLTNEVVAQIIRDTRNNDYGWSVNACFLLCQDEKKVIARFQNNDANLRLWWRIFGRRNLLGVQDPEYPDSKVFMKRIEHISRSTSSIFDSTEPIIIMAFLPQSKINKITTATIALLRDRNVIPEYEIIGINSKLTSDPKKTIEDARCRARNSGKRGVLVLSGRQCSLGVSIDNCDIVLLLNNAKGFDMVYQMMFRCMTERKGKTHGFVVDLNIHRLIGTTLVNYAEIIRPNMQIKDSLNYILNEQLITLNCDHLIPCAENIENTILSLSSKVYSIYSSNTERVLSHFLDRLKFSEILLNSEEQKAFNRYFVHSVGGRVIDIDASTEIKEGIEYIPLMHEHEKDEKDEKQEQKTKTNKKKQNDDNHNKVNYANLLRHFIPLVCILTIHNRETSFVRMCNSIIEDEKVFAILIDQVKGWWGDNINAESVHLLISTYIKYIQNNNTYTQSISGIKELFFNNMADTRQLSQLIDKYLIPQELEKKKNAEVSTPYTLRQEMLDKIPVEFWTTPKKVFEPCSGKGGFVIDIVDRFNTGLSNLITDEKERYRVIVEECLYFSDINPTNIYICSLLLDPHGEYKLNFNEGNTLELDIIVKWNIAGFDAVIGNPPYNSSGNTGTGNTIWQHFVKKAINEWLIPNGYLLYVHPSGWRKPNSIKGRFTGLFNLMTNQNQMIYLEIHGIKDGQKTFNCGTRYDWYVIEKKIKYKNTIVNDEDRKYNELDLCSITWLPNSNIIEINNMLAVNECDRCDIIYSPSVYEHRKSWMSHSKSSEYKYPCIHSITTNGTRYMYSKVNNRGHFGIPKVIISETGFNGVIIDIKGEYGMTNGAMGIKIYTLEEGKNIKQAVENISFTRLVKSYSWSIYRIDWNIIKLFKKDFWRDFI